MVWKLADQRGMYGLQVQLIWYGNREDELVKIESGDFDHIGPLDCEKMTAVLIF